MDVGLVCDACSALTPIGVPRCARCDEPVALDPRPAQVAPPPVRAAQPAPVPAATAEISCQKCGASVPPTSRFCQLCGTRVAAAASAFSVDTRVGPNRPATPSTPPARSAPPVELHVHARLTMIRGDGEDGVVFDLTAAEHVAGRGACEISFPDDAFLSPAHCSFRHGNGQLVVRDQGSLNGVYVRVSGTVSIAPGTTLLIGEQVLTIGPAPQFDDLPDAEGTYFSATMVRPATVEIVQHLRGGTTGWVYRPDSEAVSIGREGNDIDFPSDPFISGRHAKLGFSGGVLTVTDLGSRNGTFVRVQGEHVLAHGDYVFLGQQLLRVEIV